MLQQPPFHTLRVKYMLTTQFHYLEFSGLIELHDTDRTSILIVYIEFTPPHSKGC